MRDNYEYEPIDGADEATSTATRRVSLAIDTGNITNEMCELPAQLSVALERLARASAATTLAKAQRDRVIAREAIRLRAEPDANGKRMTESAIDNHVMVSPHVEAAMRDYAAAELREGLARGEVDALKAKRDMLQMVGARLRDGDGDAQSTRRHT